MDRMRKRLQIFLDGKEIEVWPEYRFEIGTDPDYSHLMGERNIFFLRFYPGSIVSWRSAVVVSVCFRSLSRFIVGIFPVWDGEFYPRLRSGPSLTPGYLHVARLGLGFLMGPQLFSLQAD